MTTTTTAATITDSQIRKLAREAGAAGDYAQVGICDRALRGSASARAVCARVVVDAKASRNGKTYTVNAVDTDAPSPWMSLPGIRYTPGSQDSGYCRYTVWTDDAETLEAALAADHDVLSYAASTE